MSDITIELTKARNNLGSIALRWCIRNLLPLDNEEFRERLDEAIMSLLLVRKQLRLSVRRRLV